MAFQFLAAWVGVWLARQQANQIEYLKTANGALLECVGKKRLRFTDAERRRFAVLGKKLGRQALGEVATIATPDTILRWYRELVAKKYDGSARRGPGRRPLVKALPRPADAIPSGGHGESVSAA